jgi:hypothetical protein
VVPVEVAEERLDVLAAPVRGRAEVLRVRVLVHVEREDRDHVVDRPEVLGVEQVVEDRPVVEVVAGDDPAARGLRALADGVLPHLHAAGVLGVDELGEAALRIAALATEVAEVQVVVLEAQQRERVVVGRQGAELGVDLVALGLGVVELLELAAKLVRLLHVALVQLVVVLHRLLGDPVEILVK